FLGNVRYAEGLQKLIFGARGEGDKSFSQIKSRIFENFEYKALTLEEREGENRTRLINQINPDHFEKLSKELQTAIQENNSFWTHSTFERSNYFRRVKELKTNFQARKLWVELQYKKWTDIEEICRILGYSKSEVLFIIQTWASVGLVNLSKTRGRFRFIYRVYKKQQNLHYILYTVARTGVGKRRERIMKKTIQIKLKKHIGRRKKYGN
ncbi:hypothetical protein, partial [Leptospira idonii]|uniref:hypothetical protein n=1 Tax=Leptospira idonii TaxID=1193500 RepID=UPI00143828EA